jgi:prepilin-type N-terminal cleavage/methylation domain-containing protein
MRGQFSYSKGFTLIEMAVVLVIIGLIVGGVLVGQDLIRAAGVRATISQVEKYNTAANTFREKYNYLPGDIKDPDASNFGFQPRGTCPGEGDGNGLIEGSNTCAAGPGDESEGETLMFWVDLSTAHLIDGGFNTAQSAQNYNPISASTTPNLAALFPAAKIGRGNYIYVYAGSAWVAPTSIPNGYNYYGISAITQVIQNITSNPALTVQEAYAIDTKIDDGLPVSGNVTAQYLGVGGYAWQNAGTANGAGVGSGSPPTGATPGSTTTCFDNSNAASGTPGVAGATQHYSLEISNGSNITCALSFKMQAGDQ